MTTEYTFRPEVDKALIHLWYLIASMDNDDITDFDAELLYCLANHPAVQAVLSVKLNSEGKVI